mgnify:CR=1 FL=1
MNTATAPSTPTVDTVVGLTTPVATPVTPAATVARVRKVKAKSSRRKYGTGLLVKRVVLLDGKPVGRGKPAKGTLKRRTFVYIPVDATYDVDTYGTGARFSGAESATKPIKTVDRSKFVAKFPKAVIA